MFSRCGNIKFSSCEHWKDGTGLQFLPTHTVYMHKLPEFKHTAYIYLHMFAADRNTVCPTPALRASRLQACNCIQFTKLLKISYATN